MLSFARQDRRFGWEMAAVKVGLTAGTLLFQRFALKRRWIKPKAAAASNLAYSGLLCGVAARNIAITR